MKKTKWILGAVVAALIIGMTGCAAIAAALAAPYGYVYDGRTGDPISGVTVTMRNLDTNSTATATTSSTGQFSFSTVDYGQFELTASLTGYFFIEQMVEVSGLSQELPYIAGLASVTSSTVSIMTLWDKEFQDVNAHLTFPDTTTEKTSFASTDFYTPLDSVSAGFLPDDNAARVQVPLDGEIYNGTTKDTELSGGDLWLETDNVGYSTQLAGGPETITMVYAPSSLGASWDGTRTYTTVANDPSGLPSGDAYTCIGVMEYYLDAWSNTEPTSVSGYPTAESGVKLSSTDNSNAANPVVYVFSGSEQKARYTLPQYTNIERATIFRINVFINSSDDIFYQFIPDIKVIDNDGTTSNIRSTNTNQTPTVIKGTRR